MMERNMENLRTLRQLEEIVKNRKEKVRLVLAGAEDIRGLQAVLKAVSSGFAECIFVGNADIIRKCLALLDQDPFRFEIENTESPQEAAERAAVLVHEGKADFLMKGMLDSSVFLKAVVSRKNGLRTDRTMSHVSLIELPDCHKLLAVTDAGMITYPTFEQKISILGNSVYVMKALGISCPGAAVLTAVEKVNEKMPVTVEAARLQEMNEKGEITGCIIEGPVSYDCALDQKTAEYKGYKSRTLSDPDILIVPDINAGNILVKSYTVTMRAKMAGIVVGAACPVVMSSRGSDWQEKYYSLLLAAAVEEKADTDVSALL